MQVKKADLSYLEQLSHIESLGFPPEEAASKAAIESRLKVFPNYFWVLEDKGEVLGFISGILTDTPVTKDELYSNANLHNPSGQWLFIMSVVVHPDFRKLGYPQLIMKSVKEDLKAEGRKGMFLACHDYLLNFYGQMGFKNQGVSSSTHGNSKWYDVQFILTTD